MESEREPLVLVSSQSQPTITIPDSNNSETSLLFNTTTTSTSVSIVDESSSSSSSSNINNQPEKTSSTRQYVYGRLHRCKTAPAMPFMQQQQQQQHHAKTTSPLSPPKSKSTIFHQGIIFLIIYLSLGILIYSLKKDNFSGIETNPVVDALYFCIVTMCTIGYGDIAPLSPDMKIFACVFVLVGFGFIDILLSGLVNYALDAQENIILTAFLVKQRPHQQRRSNFLIDVEKGRMRIRMKVGLALGVVVLCVGVGALVLSHMENLGWVDAFYLSVMSVTTVGYGDRAFKTMRGRLFAAIWLLVSTLMVARAFLYLAEARVDKRNRKVANWVLQRDITVQDLFAADINNNGFISKSEYIVYKLKEMGKICERDILLVCNHFSKVDRYNSGKITLPDLLEKQI